MLKIAICDDEEQCRDMVMGALSYIEEKWQTRFIDVYFSSGKELCEHLRESTFDVILLDIFMDDIDGIEVAKRMNEIGAECYIIFISGFQERWKELFGTKTLAFLDKPIDKDKLEMHLKEVLSLLKNKVNNAYIYK